VLSGVRRLETSVLRPLINPPSWTGKSISDITTTGPRSRTASARRIAAQTFFAQTRHVAQDRPLGLNPVTDVSAPARPPTRPHHVDTASTPRSSCSEATATS
jgi:hypothetical protein